MCLSRRVPLLLARGLVRLLVVDSVAALFRCEFQAADWLERTKQMLAVSSTLHHLSQEFSTPVLCINQVTHLSADTRAQLLVLVVLLGFRDQTPGPAGVPVSLSVSNTWMYQFPQSVGGTGTRTSSYTSGVSCPIDTPVESRPQPL